MKIRRISVRRIKHATYNPRHDLQPGDAMYDRLEQSIKTFGYVEPIVWNRRTGNLVGGHQRFKILLSQGYKKVTASVVDLSPAQEKALNIALNRIQGGWDEVKLAQLLQEIMCEPEFDVELTGFDLPEAQNLIAEALPVGPESEENEETPDFARPAVTQKDELLILGKHRLLCGDCTVEKDVRRLMCGRKAFLFATDPPYLVNYDGMNHPGRHRAGRSKNKNWSKTYGVTWDDAKANPDLYDRFYAVAVAAAIHPNAAWYCWHASRRQAMVESVWQKYGAFVHQQIIWAKDRPILSRSWYGWQHEPCFFGWVRPHKPPRNKSAPLASVWSIPTVPVGQATEHPTSKPVDLFAIPMRQHTERGDICYEPFCGSGSQLIAAERLRRRCFGLEISPHYCDVIVRRWIAYIGAANAPRDLVRRYRRKEDKP